MSGNDDANDGMAECGACRAVVPVDSEECPGCGISFTGVSETSLGECGACGALVPLESKACPQCGVVFVADDVISILGDWLSATGLTVEDLFKRFDENKDGVIEAHEFKSGLLALNIADLPESQVDRLVKALDEDGNGVIDLAELESTFAPTAEEIAEDDSSEEDEESVDEEEETVEEEDSTEDDSSEEESSDAEGEEAEETTEEEDSTEDDSSEEESSDAEEETEETTEEEEIPDTPLARMVKNFKDAGYDVKEAFEHMDVNNDGEIDGEEMTKALTEFGGGTIDENDVSAVMEELDLDDNGVITLDELMVAFGVPAEEEEPEEDEKPKEESKPKKEFPTDLHKKLMSKKANDIFWPIMHTLFAVFALLWVLNGMGTFVDGTGGSIEFEEKTVKCDPDLHGKCKNSLTPFAGDGLTSSMPAAFYADGIFFMVLGFAGLGGSLYAHLVLMKAWRAKAKGDEGDDEETSEDDSDSKEGEDSDDEKEDSDDESDDDDDESD